MLDGTRFTYDGADFGQTHTYPPNARVLKFVCRFLPDKLQSKLGVRGGYAIGQDSLFFWYRQEGKSNPRLERVLVDDQGIESAVVAYGCTQSLDNGALLHGCGASVWPRRSSRVGLRFYSADSSNRLVKAGEFWTVNPRRLRSKQWQPGRLPLTNRIDGLKVALVESGYGAIPLEPSTAQAEGARDGGYFKFRIFWNDQPTSDWQVARSTFQDATGNTLESWERSQSVGDAEILVSRGVFRDGANVTVLPYSLWPGEAAWKVQVEFAPRATAAFPPEQLCTFARVPVPRQDQSFSLNLETNVSGTKIKLEALCGKATLSAAEAAAFPTGHALLIQPSFGGCLPVITKIVDNLNRSISVKEPVPVTRQMSPRSWRTFSSIPLEIPSDSRELTLTIGAMTNRVAVFLTPPPPFPRAAAALP